MGGMYATSSIGTIHGSRGVEANRTLQAGITHCFVNLGSDHPSILEAMVKGQQERKGRFPRIITCPNEVYDALID